jgi:uncharacterized protein YjiS (DUF1127 family)
MPIERQFLWQWENHKPMPDSLMNCGRALRLLKAWRGQMRTPVNGPRIFRVKLIRHIDRWNEYRVTHKSGETGSLWIRREQ